MFGYISILSFKFCFYYFIVQVLVFSCSWCVSVCHLDFGGGNPYVKYLCAVANFRDEYYLVIGPFCIFCSLEYSSCHSADSCV